MTSSQSDGIDLGFTSQSDGIDLGFTTEQNQ